MRMRLKAVLFLAGVFFGCGGVPRRVEPPPEVERREIKRYLPPVPVTKELNLLKHLRYAEYPQEHNAPYKPGWSEPGETYPLDTVESVLGNMRPVWRAIAAIVERPGAIEPVDYDDLRHFAGRLRMHAEEIYRLQAGEDAEEVFVRDKFSKVEPSNEWCLRMMGARIERATLLKATEELRKLWEEFKQVARACNLEIAGVKRPAPRK